MRIKTFSALLLVLALSVSINAQTYSQKIENLLDGYYSAGQFNGAVLVAKNGKVIYERGHGLAQMEWGIPNTADTKFRIGSVTKQMTAVIVLQLVEEGKIKLGAKITEYLSDYRKDTGDRVTIHQLLNHTSGIPSYTSAEFLENHVRNRFTPKELVKRFASGDFEFEPGSKYSYNNSGYFLLGVIIEKVTGKGFFENLEERITKPLGMTNTHNDNAAALVKNRAKGYSKILGGYENAPYIDMSWAYSAGSLYSTVGDLYKWNQSFYTNKLLSKESLEKMNTPGKADYGYGVVVKNQKYGKTDKTVPIIQHSGGIHGFATLFTRLPKDKHLVVLIDNTTQGNTIPTITNDIIAILKNEAVEIPKRSVGDVITETVLEDGQEAAVKQYRDLRKTHRTKYDFREDSLNSLGYQLLRAGKTTEAIRMFELNVEMFPKSSNPYDSLGEAYLKAGEKKKSLASYKKALELDPKNTRAKSVIDSLTAPSIKLSSDELKKFVGTYDGGPVGNIAVTLDSEKLWVQLTGQPRFELVPQTKNSFMVVQVGAKFTFTTDSNGNATDLTLNQNGQELKAKKKTSAN